MGDSEQVTRKSISFPRKSTKSFHNFGGKSFSRSNIRKSSYGFSGGISIERVQTSNIGAEFKRPALIYSNTYQLEPREKFNIEPVTKIVEQMIDDNFTKHKYSDQASPELALRLAGDLMRRIKLMNFNRYRIISVVTIGQKRSQSFANTISFLWDHERDNYVEVHRETATALIQVLLFAVYLD